MKDSNAIVSVTGKVLGNIFFDFQGFGFKHFSGAFKSGFDSWQDARDAFIVFHEDWFENNCD